MDSRNKNNYNYLCRDNCRNFNKIKMAAEQMSSALFFQHYAFENRLKLFFEVKVFVNEASFTMDEVIPNILETLLAEVVLNDKLDAIRSKQCIKTAGRGLKSQTEDSEFNFESNIHLISQDNQSSSTEMKETIYKTFNISNRIRLYEIQDSYERKGESESESEDEKGKSSALNDYKSLSESNSTHDGKRSPFVTSTPNRTPIHEPDIQFKSPDEISNIVFKESLEDMDLSISSYETVFDSFIQTPTDYEKTEELNYAIEELINKIDINKRQDAAIQTILTENIFFPANCCKCRLKYFERESIKPLCLEYPSLFKK